MQSTSTNEVIWIGEELDVEIGDGDEFFYRAKLLIGEATQWIPKNQFEYEQLILQLRLHDNGTSTRHHSTEF